MVKTVSLCLFLTFKLHFNLQNLKYVHVKMCFKNFGMNLGKEKPSCSVDLQLFHHRLVFK